MAYFVGLFVVVAALVLTGEAIRRYRLRGYFRRRCTGPTWRREFPAASKQDIRQFLDCVLIAFAFPERRRFAFAPNDRLIDIYNADNSAWLGLGVDEMQLETFGREVEDLYRLNLWKDWRDDLTLGELFARTLTPNED